MKEIGEINYKAHNTNMESKENDLQNREHSNSARQGYGHKKRSQPDQVSRNSSHYPEVIST